jgi:hypothetical protein
MLMKCIYPCQERNYPTIHRLSYYYHSTRLSSLARAASLNLSARISMSCFLLPCPGERSCIIINNMACSHFSLRYGAMYRQTFNASLPTTCQTCIFLWCSFLFLFEAWMVPPNILCRSRITGLYELEHEIIIFSFFDTAKHPSPSKNPAVYRRSDSVISLSSVTTSSSWRRGSPGLRSADPTSVDHSCIWSLTYSAPLI